MTRTRFGSLLSGNTEDVLQRYVFLYGVWEPNLTRWIASHLQRGDTFIDVGANIGYFSLLASRIVDPRGAVVAVEASPSIFRTLTRNIALNCAKNIRAINAAASNVSGTVRVFRGPSSNIALSSIFSEAGHEDEGLVAAEPLHKLLLPREVARTRLVKVDVEGAEVSVIEGLLPLVSSMRRDAELVVEVGGAVSKDAPSAQEAASAIIEMLTDEGFNVYKIDNDYRPAAYAHRATGRAKRVSDDTVESECDLIFSRRDASFL